MPTPIPTAKKFPPGILFPLVALFLFCACQKEDESRFFQIEAGSAVQTIKLFAEQANSDVVFENLDLMQVRTHEVKGEMKPDEALQLMISDTPLAFDFDPYANVYTIKANPRLAHSNQ